MSPTGAKERIFQGQKPVFQGQFVERKVHRFTHLACCRVDNCYRICTSPTGADFYFKVEIVQMYLAVALTFHTFTSEDMQVYIEYSSRSDFKDALSITLTSSHIFAQNDP